MVKSMLLDSAKKGGLIVCALIFMLAAQVAPAQDVTGEWDVEIDFQGNLAQAKIVLEMKDGALAGKFISEQGENELAEVKFEDGKLTFMRHVEFGGQAFDLAFQGTIEGDELKGNFVSDFGDIPVTGKRGGAADVKPGLPGVWNLMVESQLGNNERTLTVKDDLTGTYGFEGETYALKDTKVDGDKITFGVTIDVQGQELEMAFVGTMDGAALKGELSFEGGTATVEGTKAGGPEAEEAIAGPVNLPGTWELKGDPGDGSGGQVVRLAIREVDGIFTANMRSDMGDLTIDKIVVEGNDISFTTEFSLGDPSVPGIPLEFKGKVGSGRVKGTLTIKMEGFEQAFPLEGEKISDETTLPATSP